MALGGRPSKMDAVQEYHCKDGQTLKDLLISLHIGQNKSFVDIADALYVPEDKSVGREEMRISKSTVNNWLDLFDIPARDACPPAVVKTIENAVVDKSKKQPIDKAITNFDPKIEGFKCSSQCPHYDMCKYKDDFENNICPVSTDKKNKFIKPIREIINSRYKEDGLLLTHYSNIAELAASVWEILHRKMSYIQSEDVTQLLNRPDPVTGELKQVKVANLLNGEIQKDQGTLVKLLELLKLTPKTADELGDGKEDFLSRLFSEVQVAKQGRIEKQSQIDIEQAAKNNRTEIKTPEDFRRVMQELKNRNSNNPADTQPNTENTSNDSDDSESEEQIY